MNMNSFLLVEDTRLGAHIGSNAQYQIGIKINNQKEFDKVNQKLSNFLKTKHKCKKTKDGFFVRLIMIGKYLDNKKEHIEHCIHLILRVHKYI